MAFRQRRRCLRYALIWPIVAHCQWACRRSLRWRLTGSHLATVFLSVLTISVIGALGLLVFSHLQDPVHREPANEARAVSEMITELGWTDTLGDERTSFLLAAVTTGKVGPNYFDQDINLHVGLGADFANIKTISIVGQDQHVIASSDPTLVGKNAIQIAPAALGVARAALDGSTSTAENSVMDRPGRQLVTGAYPIWETSSPSGGLSHLRELTPVGLVGPILEEGNANANTPVVAAVVVDKRQRTLATGSDLVLLSLNSAGKIGLTILILVGIPAIPVGAIVGIRRARAISKPVTELAKAAELVASGDLSARARLSGEDELAALGGSFNYMAESLERSMAKEAAERAKVESLLEANRALVANVSHELRTPVALVRGHLEALQNEPERHQEYTRIALRETDRLERLVNDLFQLARLEVQAVKPDVEPFDAGSAVREAVESLAEPTRREAGIAMQADIGAGTLRCLGDRARLVQVLQNLIRNAIRFTPEGGIILVGAHNQPDGVEISVRDTGIGIAPEDLPQVFERFFRTDQSRSRAGGGAGLGLAIARQLVEGMGGEISVESVIDEGSVFTIRLPRAGAEVEADASEQVELVARDRVRAPTLRQSAV